MDVGKQDLGSFMCRATRMKWGARFGQGLDRVKRDQPGRDFLLKYSGSSNLFEHAVAVYALSGCLL